MKKIFLLIIINLSLICFTACKKEEKNKKEYNNTGYKITYNQKTLEVPKDKVFLDCTDIDNIYIAIGKTVNSHHYKTQLTGSVVGVKWFITYKQTIESIRVYNDNTYFSSAVSLGSFKKLAFQRYINEYDYRWREGTKNSEEIEWNEIHYDNESKFYEQYGQGPWGVTSYVINDDTIKEIVKEKIEDDYLFKVTLDQILATQYYQYEIRQSAGVTDLPEFESVKIEIRMNDNWEIKSIQYYEEYTLNVLGGILCKCDMKETYTYYNEYIETEALKEFLTLMK